jgi:hypothetical protein
MIGLISGDLKFLTLYKLVEGWLEFSGYKLEDAENLQQRLS